MLSATSYAVESAQAAHFKGAGMGGGNKMERVENSDSHYAIVYL
jgi:hypothetical protein